MELLRGLIFAVAIADRTSGTEKFAENVAVVNGINDKLDELLERLAEDPRGS